MQASTFIPLGMFSGSTPHEPALLARTNNSGTGGIEIVLPSGARLSVDASVNEQALSRVLRAVKSAT
jgi:hypothetical protein